MDSHWYSKRTQIYWTCNALVQGRTINHMDEIGETRGWRLGAIIHTLRHQYGWPIETEYRGSERIAHYRLPGRGDWRALQFPSSALIIRDQLGEAAHQAGNGAENASVAPQGLANG